MPKISAIITTFNRAQFLKKAIESVLNQTNPKFELLVLDNSSTDGTEKVVRSFDDKRIRYIRHSPLNISQARNFGVKEAKGEYIAFLDDDDEWLPNKLRAQLEVFEKSSENVALVYGGFIWFDPAREKYIKKHYPKLRGRVLEGLLAQDAFTGSASNPVIKKSVYDIVGLYDEEVITGEDWEFYLRLARKFMVDFTDEMVVKIRQHSGPRLGDKLEDTAKLEMKVMEDCKDIFDKNRKLKSFYLQKIGGKFCRIGNPVQGRRYIKDAIITYPFNFPAYFQCLFSFFSQSFYKKMHKIYKNVFG